MPNNQSNNVVTLEDARIIFRNFSGKEKPFNEKGKRNFSVLLDTDVAEAMMKDGWNIKWLKPRDDDEDQLAQAHLPVKLNYKGRPPRVVLITARGRTTLTEDVVEMADWADIKSCDLMIRPYDWEMNGKTGRTAYLNSIYIVIDETELDLKYAGYEEIKAPGENNFQEPEEGDDE